MEADYLATVRRSGIVRVQNKLYSKVYARYTQGIVRVSGGFSPDGGRLPGYGTATLKSGVLLNQFRSIRDPPRNTTAAGVD
eukprot:5216244-Pyramimonas_sp.AAC.1